jgi:hypothetical protein
MSDNNPFGFGKFVPGFDFLQNLSKGASPAMPQLPGMSSWVAPTLNVEEVEKRISELKAVQFWLDQNGKALAATIQALEVQKMTLATLKTMNFNMAELAESFKVKPLAQPDQGKPTSRSKGASGNGADAGASPVDPVQWWGALTQQFQEIAAGAMKDVAQMANADASAAQVTAPKEGSLAAPRKAAPRKAAGAKSTPRKSSKQ